MSLTATWRLTPTSTSTLTNPLNSDEDLWFGSRFNVDDGVDVNVAVKLNGRVEVDVKVDVNAGPRPTFDRRLFSASELLG